MQKYINYLHVLQKVIHSEQLFIHICVFGELFDVFFKIEIVITYKKRDLMFPCGNSSLFHFYSAICNACLQEHF